MKNIEEEYLELKDRIQLFIDGEISSLDFKHDSAPLGIYQQRNGMFMMRLRFTGGHVSTQVISEIADVMDLHGVKFSHITSRQDLQLHDVEVANIYPILLDLLNVGIPFRGGGGNTYRNILVSSDSGISENDVFDVLPHAEALNNFYYSYEKAFDLPRKFKVGFSASSDDSIKAIMQDLGFIATINNGERGFVVFGGGGMGKESVIGVKLFDFIPEKAFAKCAKAMIDLFYDHGNREDRNSARLRFVLKRLGEDKFTELFYEYFNKSEVELHLEHSGYIEKSIKYLNASIRGIDRKQDLRDTSIEKIEETHPEDGPLTPLVELKSECSELLSSSNLQWQKYAITNTKFGDDVVSVRVFVPYGNLTSKDIRKVAKIAEKCGVEFIKLTQAQDIIFPLVDRTSLPFIFLELEHIVDDIDLLLSSFKGHLTSCIGAKVCKIGVADAPSLCDSISDKLDRYFIGFPEAKGRLTTAILEDVKVSGCHNGCSGHIVTEIGIQGFKKRIEGSVEEGGLLFNNGFASYNSAKLASSDNEFVTKNEISKVVNKFLQ